MGLPQQTRVEKTAYEWGHADLLVKKMFWIQLSVIKSMLTVFWVMKGSNAIDFLEKGV